VNAKMAVPFPDMLPNLFPFACEPVNCFSILTCAHGNDPPRLTGSENKS
jgi:hypothetical protein